MPSNNIFNIQSTKQLSASVLRTLGGGSDIPIMTYPIGLGGSPRGNSDIPFVLFAPYKRPENSPFASVEYRKVFDELPSPEFAIALPIPSSALKTTYGVGYEEFDLGSAGNIATGIKKIWQDVSSTKSREDNNLTVLEQLFEKGNEVALRSAYNGIASGGGVIDALTGSNFKEAFKKFSGVALNPFTETLFKDVKIRTHDFNYIFHPKDIDESIIVDRIIQVFKFYMLPAAGAAPFGTTSNNSLVNYFSFPNEFQITYSVSDTTFTLLPSVLEDMTVDYGGEGTPAFFFSKDNSAKRYPTKIELTLKFKEIMFLTRDKVVGDESIVGGNQEIVDGKVVDTTKYRFRF